MSRAMIVTLGGSPEPIVKSINKYSPDMVFFLASHQSIKEIGSVLEGLEKSVEHKTYIVNNPQDLLDVYRRCEEILKEKDGYDEVLVDYTGGTKSMSVGVVLWGIGHGCHFTYVGGTKRTKNGLGVVRTGLEKIVPQENPFDVLAIWEKERGIRLFNRYQFEATIKEFESALAKVQDSVEEQLISALKGLSEAYYAWDIFNRESNGVPVIKKLADSKKTLDYLTKLAGRDHSALISAIDENIRFFSGKSKKGIRPETVADIYLNAERRGEEGKYDDGVARLYRCIELIAQHRLSTEFGIDTSNVDIGKLPGEDMKRKYEKQRVGNKIRIGLKKGFELLQDLGDDVGKRYLESERGLRLQELLSSRNNSILAHGLDPVEKNVFDDLKSETHAFLKEMFPEIDDMISKGRFPKF